MTKPWTAKEVQTLRRHYGPKATEPLSLNALAQKLSRTRSAVFGAAVRHGVAKKYKVATRRQDAMIRSLSQWGRTNKEIAVALKWSVAMVRRRVKILKIKKRNDHWKRRHKKTVQRQLFRHFCVKSLAAVRDQRRRVQCLLAGWPGAHSRREVEVLELLKSTGQSTVMDLARRLPVQRREVQTLLKRMHDRGLVQLIQPSSGTRSAIWGLQETQHERS